MAKRIVVSGGGANLYRIETSGSYYLVYHIRVGLIFDDKNYIGKARSFEDALSLIRSYSGRRIIEIS